MFNRIFAIATLAAACSGGSSQAEWSTTANSEPRETPAAFDYYTLVLSWSPTHCSTTDRGTDDGQCARDDGARFGFVLHGLWPQFERGYPDSCRTRWKPFVPDQVIASVANIMPSRGLVIHEYRQHGSCSGLRPDAYFALATQLFNRVNIPQRFRNPQELQLISPSDALEDFMRANPGLRPEMIAVTCDGQSLRDVRICLTKEGRARSCGENEHKEGACRTPQMRVLPVRSRKWDYQNNRALPLKIPPKPPKAVQQQAPPQHQAVPQPQ
jgi:ribonuclease T2